MGRERQQGGLSSSFLRNIKTMGFIQIGIGIGLNKYFACDDIARGGRSGVHWVAA